MSLKALLLCSDEKIVRVLRRTLGDLEIEVEVCSNTERALRKLTRHRFEAIIVDCSDKGSADVLRSARAALCNKRAVAVAILDERVGLRSVFDLGAHFVLYKPVSSERAKSSFRAARALMKRERRRNSRVTVQIPVALYNTASGANIKVTTADVSEGGMAVNVPKRHRPTGRWQAMFTLPGTDTALKVFAEFAWEGAGARAGLRFLEVAPEVSRQLREWLQCNSPEAEQEDPPVRCRMTDLSLGGCYLEIASPFPAGTEVTLSMRASGIELRAEGVVRVMHQDKGMGVEFTQTTGEHRDRLHRFLEMLTGNREIQPELLVQAEGLELDSSPLSDRSDQVDDPLVELFRSQAALSAESFAEELRKQRGIAAMSASGSA
jgi:c-di-GMP-binding flagellar brake protein YcgR